MLRIKKYVRLGAEFYEDQIQYVLDISSVGINTKQKTSDDQEKLNTVFIDRLRLEAGKCILKEGGCYLMTYIWNDAFEDYRFESSKYIEFDDISSLLKGDY